jgi:hypothetical protein
VNLALDRFAFYHPLAGRPTSQYLPEHVLGFKERQVYPLNGDLPRAKALADGNLRGGKAVLYVTDFSLPLANAQQLKQQLAGIGLEVEIRYERRPGTGASGWEWWV